MPYLLDANVFIPAKNLHYGLDFCPAFRDWLVSGNTSGQVFSIEKVGDEIAAGDDELSEWAAERGNAFFLPPDEAIVRALGTVGTWATHQSYEPAVVSTFMQVADCFLVAHALAHGHTLVTHETPVDSRRRIKIPNACIGVGVKFMTPYEMLRRERARFVLGPSPAKSPWPDPSARLARLFARGEAGAKSDIDILIELDPQAPVGLFEYVGITQYLFDLFPVRVDVANRSGLKPLARTCVERDAVYAF